MCRPICRPHCISNPREWQPPCPYIPPKAAEKLNVGEPGQLKPNINDCRSSLKETVQTVPDLIDLVNSAADDLGVDLDYRPSARDDETFRNAPFEDEPQNSVTLPSEPVVCGAEVKSAEANPVEEDSWLQKTRTHLTELSAVRTQLMDELNAIAEDLGVQIDEGSQGEKVIEPTSRGSSRSLLRRSTRLTNKSIDSATNLRDVGTWRTSTSNRYPDRSRRGSSVPQGWHTISKLPVHRVQNWWRAAQTELPAAIGAIASVLGSVPTVDYIVPDFVEDGSDEQDVYEEYPQEIQEEDSVLDYEDELVPEPQPGDVNETVSRLSLPRRYTEPFLDLRNRGAVLGRDFKEEAVKTIDQEFDESSKHETLSTSKGSDLELQKKAQSQGEDALLQKLSISGMTSSTSEARANANETEGEQGFSSEL